MSDKISDYELWRRLTGCPEAGSLWRHYKTGDTYAVTGAAIAEATQEPLVLYQRGLVTFARPLKEFQEEVSPGVFRFTAVP